MRNRTLINAAIGLVLLGALFVRNVRADEWDKKTIVSFSAPVQIPGTVLPAGTYVFKDANLGVFHAALRVPEFRAERSGTGHGGVDVQPDVVFAADARELGDGVDGVG